MVDGPAFYDDDAIFQTYMARRQRPDNPNDTIERPDIYELIGDLNNRRILDLGCGDASFGRDALAHGCASYLGIDGSHNMIERSEQTLAGTAGRVEQATLEHWSYPLEAFDLVVSRLALHYIADIETVFHQVFRSLVPQGRFVFSVEHPVITSCDRAWKGAGKRQAWLVDNYFESGQRTSSWMGGTVRKYHRTIEDYFGSLQCVGFRVDSLREAMPRPEMFGDDAETYQRRRRIPLFLILASQKP